MAIMIEQEQFCASPRTEFMRGKRSTRQTLSDAWDATNWGCLCGTPWQMVPRGLELTNKVTADKDGAGPPLPRIAVERILEAEPRRFHVLSVDTGGFVWFVQRWHRMEERSNHKTTNVEKESERSLREP